MAYVGKMQAKGRWYTRCFIHDKYGEEQRIVMPYIGNYVKNKIPQTPTAKRSSRAETKVLRLLQDIERCFAENIEANLTTVPELATANPKLKKKLHKKNLVKLNDSDSELYKLNSFFKFCLDREEERVGAQSNSIGRDMHNKWKNVATLATEFFSRKGVIDIREITADHADEYRDHRLKNRASSTVQSEVKYLRTVFFERAINRRLLTMNPFKKTKVQIVKAEIEERRVVVKPEILARVDSVITNFNWKLYWNLVRWTGARASEPMKLKWKGVCFETGRITMPAPKTAKQGMPCRQLPLFEELLPILEEAFHLQDRRSLENYVVQDIAGLPKSNRENKSRPSTNAGTDIKRFVEKAGVEPWEKPLQNLRVTREDELIKSGEYSAQAVHAFIGHSNDVYLKHYQAKLTDADFIPRSQRTDATATAMETTS